MIEKNDSKSLFLIIIFALLFCLVGIASLIGGVSTSNQTLTSIGIFLISMAMGSVFVYIAIMSYLFFNEK